MQGAVGGLSLNEIATRFGVSRKTAERLRDAIGDRFGHLEQVNRGEVPKRWRLRSGTVNGFIKIVAEDLASLSTAAALLERERMSDQADRIDRVATILRALSTRPALTRIEADLEALTEAEGLALHPGPKPKISSEIIASLREAILACRKVRLHYLYRVSGKRGYQVVHPYGFLYGNRHYLVAWNESEKARDFRNYALSNIERVEVLDEPFRRRKFSLQDYAGQSFGTFREEPSDVVLKFSAKAAPDACDYLFHPSQKLESQEDGSLVARFHAGGLKEIAWHLVTWLPEVEVIAPKRLQELLIELAGFIVSDKPPLKARKSGQQ
jgi:predicted DNA-binding transcriptional regulator YafY